MPIRFPGLPSGCSRAACPCSGRSMAAAPKRIRPWAKAGPRRAPTRSGVAASQHRDGAHPRRLQLAGHREGGEQGHKARLLHRPAAAADVDCDAGLSKGFAAAGIDVHEHLADWAAESGGGHGWMAKNTESAPCRRGRARASPCRDRQRRNRRGLACVSPGAAVVVRALLVEGLARPVAGAGSCCFRLRGCCSPVNCLLRPAVHVAGPLWLPVVRRLVPLQRSPPSPACEPGCAGGFRCSGWLVRPWYPCGLSQPQGRGGRDRPASPDPLRRAVAAAAADQGAPTAAPASAGGAHLPPALQGARGSGCCRPHRGRAGTRCSNPATRGGDGCAEWRARKQWVAQRRTLPSGGARSRTRIAGLARSLRPPRRVGGPGRSLWGACSLNHG